MDGPMTTFERRMLKRIAKRIVTQGPDHKRNITEYYAIIEEAATAEFTEDTKPTLTSFIDECKAASNND